MKNNETFYGRYYKPAVVKITLFSKGWHMKNNMFSYFTEGCDVLRFNGHFKGSQQYQVGNALFASFIQREFLEFP